jgi:hypothetical protein
MPSANFQANGGSYMQMDGNTENLYVDHSTSITGNNNNVNWIW